MHYRTNIQTNVLTQNYLELFCNTPHNKEVIDEIGTTARMIVRFTINFLECTTTRKFIVNNASEFLSGFQ